MKNYVVCEKMTKVEMIGSSGRMGGLFLDNCTVLEVLIFTRWNPLRISWLLSYANPQQVFRINS